MYLPLNFFRHAALEMRNSRSSRNHVAIMVSHACQSDNHIENKNMPLNLT